LECDLESGEAPKPLAYWRFNESSLATEGGIEPFSRSRVKVVDGLDGKAVELEDAGGPPSLHYPAKRPGGEPMIDLRDGSVRLLFRPLWASRNPWASPGYGWGKGPGRWVRLFEVGGANDDQLMGLTIDPLGTNLLFYTKGPDGRLRTNFRTRISWTHLQGTSGTSFPVPWREVMVAWSPSGCRVVVEGKEMQDTISGSTTGRGVTYSEADLRNVEKLALGCGILGGLSAHGALDEIETFDSEIGPLRLHSFLERSSIRASTTAAPVSVKLEWYDARGRPSSVQRRIAGEEAWTPLAEDVAGTSYVDRDPALRLGQVYEYEVGRRKILVALRGRPVESRGRIILLVDETIAPKLSAELRQLRADLAGDGWKVVRHDVPRHNDQAWAAEATNPSYIQDLNLVKSLVLTEYRSEPDATAAVFLIGHVVIPYSGIAFEDGHFDHNGAWPADSYYGDVDGIWSDSVMNSGANIAHPVRKNLPGDGKLDPSTFRHYTSVTNGLELAVGRIDCASLPAFAPANEAALLKRYLKKIHRYRHKQISFDRHVTAGAYFDKRYHLEGDAIYDNASLLASRLFPHDPAEIVPGDCFRSAASSVWGIHGGYGSGTSINWSERVNQEQGLQKITPAYLADPSHEPKVGFFLVKGSYFGDWNYSPDSIIRSLLCTPNYGLGAVWVRSTRWSWEPLGLGEPIGRAFVRTARGNVSTRVVFVLGDPALRMTVTAPPRDLAVQKNHGVVTLNWAASAEADAGYAVYRSVDGPDGEFTRINGTPIRTTGYTDEEAPIGRKVYMVRALQNVATGSGSFTNLSQGLFVESF
jgi:hypothetical protein